MKRLLVAGICVAALCLPAVAADMPAKAVSKAPAVAPVSWTGPYIGIGLGARVLDSDWTTTATFDPTGAPIPPSTDPNASFSDTAFRASVFIGYNWQTAPAWVFGLEADLGWANNHDTESSRIPGLGVVGAGSFAEVEGSWDASVRARVGYLFAPTWLGYLTGGVAFQHIEATATCPADTTVCNPAFGTQSFSSSDTRVGWTIGAGLEAVLAPNLLGRLEYRYADFGDFSFVAIPPTATTFGANATVSPVSHTVTLGLAWKL